MDSKKRARNKFFKRIKKSNPKNLDTVIHQLHDEAFKKIDCLDCANCCKTTGPLWTKRDRQKVSKHLGYEVLDFEKSYLKIDEDGDYVLQQLPCPFLIEDNKCGIYAERPSACADYPHTNRPKQKQILQLTELNSNICPAVESIVERMEIIYSKHSKRGLRI